MNTSIRTVFFEKQNPRVVIRVVLFRREAKTRREATFLVRHIIDVSDKLVTTNSIRIYQNPPDQFLLVSIMIQS